MANVEKITFPVPITMASESILSPDTPSLAPSVGLGSSIPIDPIVTPILPGDPLGGPKATSSPLSKDTRGKLLLNIATNLQKFFSFAKDKAGILYVYSNGVFIPTAEALINRAIKTALTQRSILHRWDSGMCTHVCKFLLVDCPQIPEIPPTNLINLLNGMLDVSTKTLLPHSPSYLSYIQLSVNYDPSASTEPWDEFISQIFPPDCQSLAYEIAGWLVRPLLFVQKAILLVGEGSNGKSTFLTGIKTILGKSNFSTTSIHTLQTNRFAAHTLMGKLANICSDLPDKRLEDSDMFKAITGNDGIQVEVKHGERFNLSPFSRLVFSANNPPGSRDASFAYFRRWIIVPFPYEFRPEKPGFKSPDQIEAELFNPIALSGFFNRILSGSISIESRKYFDIPASAQAALNNFIHATSPVHRWLEESAILDEPSSWTPKKTLLKSYNSWRLRNGYGYQQVVEEIFFKELRKAWGLDDFVETRKGKQGKQVRCIVGIKLKDEDFEVGDTLHLVRMDGTGD